MARKVSASPEDQQRIELASRATEEYLGAAKAWMQKDKELKQVFLPKIKQNGENVIATARAVQADAWKQSDGSSEQTESIVRMSNSIIALLLLLGVAVGCALSWIIGRSVTRPIQKVITNVDAASNLIAEASAQISNASMQLAEGTSQQAAAIEETSSSLEEISSMTSRTPKTRTRHTDSCRRPTGSLGKQATLCRS